MVTLLPRIFRRHFQQTVVFPANSALASVASNCHPPIIECQRILPQRQPVPRHSTLVFHGVETYVPFLSTVRLYNLKIVKTTYRFAFVASYVASFYFSLQRYLISFRVYVLSVCGKGLHLYFQHSILVRCLLSLFVCILQLLLSPMALAVFDTQIKETLGV